MKVLAFDPGETTGWAVLSPGNLEAGEFPAWQEVRNIIKHYSPQMIVIEEFRLRPSAALALTWTTFPTIEVIGVIKFLAESFNIPCKTQTAAQAKVFKLKLNLKALEGVPNHAGDALRHAICCQRTLGHFAKYRHLIRRERG